MNKKLLIFICLQVAISFFPVSATQKANGYSIDIYEKVKEIPSDTQKIKYLLESAREQLLSNEQLALELALNGAYIALETKHTGYIIESHLLIGQLLNQAELFKEAADLMTFAVKMVDTLQYSAPLMSLYGEISQAYFGLRQPSIALSWGKKALAGYHKLKLDKQEKEFLLTTAIRLFENAFYNQALSYFQRLLQEARDSEDKTYLAMINDYLGKTFYQQARYHNALDYFFNSLYIYQDIQAQNGEAMLCSEIAKTYLQLNQFSKAIEFANYAIDNSNETEYSEAVTDAYNVLSLAYASMNQFKKAYEYEILYQKNKERLERKKEEEKENRLLLSRAMNNILLTVRLEKEKENAITELKNKANRGYLFLISAIILVGALLSALLIYCTTSRVKQRKNIKLLNNELKQTRQALEEKIKTSNKFFAIISHDLKNPFNALLGFSHLLYSEYDEFTDIEKKKYIKQIYEASDSINKLLLNLLQWAKSQSGQIHLRKEAINISNVINRVLPLVKPQADSKKIKIKADINQSLSAYADENMINTVIRNLITNAIKYTPEYGEITLNARQKSHFVEVKISDTGIGMSQELIDAIFNGNSQPDLSKIKKFSSVTSGLGLTLCKEFIYKNDGKIYVESQVGKGTTFTFTLPVSSN